MHSEQFATIQSSHTPSTKAYPKSHFSQYFLSEKHS